MSKECTQTVHRPPLLVLLGVCLGRHGRHVLRAAARRRRRHVLALATRRRRALGAPCGNGTAASGRQAHRRRRLIQARARLRAPVASAPAVPSVMAAAGSSSAAGGLARGCSRAECRSWTLPSSAEDQRAPSLPELRAWRRAWRFAQLLTTALEPPARGGPPSDGHWGSRRAASSRSALPAGAQHPQGGDVGGLHARGAQDTRRRGR